MLFLQFIFMDVKQNVEEQLEFVYVLIDFLSTFDRRHIKSDKSVLGTGH